MTLFEHLNTLTLNSLSRLYRILPHANNHSQSAILCYHSVSDTGWRFATPVEVFRAHIDFLKKHYSIVSLDQMVRNKPKNAVCITFDDGYKDVLQNAYPILEKENIKATVFAIGSRTGVNRHELDNILDIMTDEEILRLKNAGWGIGFHTRTHPDLETLTEDQLHEECVVGKKEMEKRLSIRVQYFAYPKGKYNKKILRAVEDGAYESAFTVDGGRLDYKNKLLITRIPMEGLMSTDQLDALLSPFGQIIYQVYMYILQKKEKVAQKLKSFNKQS